MERISGARIVEDFKIFINSLYEHQSLEENKKIVEEFEKELKAMGGNLQAFVKVAATLPKKKTMTTTYRIDDVAFGGFNLPEDTETFEVSVDLYSRVKEGNITASGIKTPFKSMLFILSENAKVLTNVNASQGICVVRDMELYSEKTGNRIRFGEPLTQEV